MRSTDDKPGVGTTDRDPPQIRDKFMRGLGAKKRGVTATRTQPSPTSP